VIEDIIRLMMKSSRDIVRNMRIMIRGKLAVVVGQQQ
jgi:hypothetical protein